MTYIVSGVSFSGLDSENVQGIPCTSLEEAREYAHFLLKEAEQFSAWVQGEGINECHTAICIVAGCPAAE